MGDGSIGSFLSVGEVCGATNIESHGEERL